MRSWAPNEWVVEDPDELEIAEAILDFPHINSHSFVDLIIGEVDDSHAFRSRLQFCLMIDAKATVSYESPETDGTVVFTTITNQCDSFTIDDSGGCDITLPTDFLVDRNEVINLAIDYINNLDTFHLKHFVFSEEGWEPVDFFSFDNEDRTKRISQED